MIQDHLRERGRAVVLRPGPDGEMIALITEAETTPLILVSEILATPDGRIRANVENAMAAVRS